MAKKFKPKKEKRFMECDICERFDFQFIINLKEACFSSRGSQKERNARRVCFYCGLYLFKEKIYNFSYVWRETFFEQLKRVGFNTSRKGTPSANEFRREKYMVIHK